MRRDRARLQLLALLLLAGMGLLCFDLDPIKAAVADYLHGMPDTETAVADEAPALAAPGLSSRAPVMAAADKPTTLRRAARPAAAQAGAVAAPASRIRAWARIDRIRTASAPRPVLRGLEDARRRLGLSPEQALDLGRIASDAQRDLEDLRYARNACGQSWHGIVAEVRLIPALEETYRMAETMNRLARFVDTRLSGRDETYRETHRRLLDGCRDLAGRLLSNEQQQTLAAFDSDPVFDDSPHAAALTGRHDRLAHLGGLVRCAKRLDALEQRGAAG